MLFVYVCVCVRSVSVCVRALVRVHGELAVMPNVGGCEAGKGLMARFSFVCRSWTVYMLEMSFAKGSCEEFRREP